MPYYSFADDLKDCDCTDGFEEYWRYDEAKNFIGFCTNEKGRENGQN